MEMHVRRFDNWLGSFQLMMPLPVCCSPSFGSVSSSLSSLYSLSNVYFSIEILLLLRDSSNAGILINYNFILLIPGSENAII